MFYDNDQGRRFRSREANVYRLAETQTTSVDQCVQGVPSRSRNTAATGKSSFARGTVSRDFTHADRTRTTQAALLGCYQAACRQLPLEWCRCFHNGDARLSFRQWNKRRNHCSPFSNLRSGKKERRDTQRLHVVSPWRLREEKCHSQRSNGHAAQHLQRPIAL